MKAKFYLLYLMPRTGLQPDDPRIGRQLNKALDWIGITPNTWILHSTSTPEKLCERFKGLVQPGGRIFVCELNLAPGHRSGWMNGKFWTWIKERRQKYPS